MTWHVRVVPETGSTNDDLLRAAERGDLEDRSVLRTGHQTGGRGRLGRRWDAPPGTNLLASMYLKTHGGRPIELMHRVGLAVVDGIESLSEQFGCRECCPGELALKWPNDVLLGDQKLAGVLAQTSTIATGIVVGFGVNVGWSPPGAAKVADWFECDPAELLDAVLDAFDRLPADTRDAYVARLGTIGRRVALHLPGDEIVDGIATGVDADGRLLLSDDRGTTRAFDVGDVVHLRPHR